MSYITADLIEYEVFETLTESVGQYTGLKDKNGKRIFEEDIAKVNISGKTVIREIKFEYGSYGIDGLHPASFIPFCNILSDCIEIVGNRWDNPELLEVE